MQFGRHNRNNRGAPLARRPSPARWYLEVLFPALAANDVRSLETLRSLDHVERDALTLGERLEAGSLDRREVNEHVLAAFLGDETETLRLVEPLHGT